MPHLPDHQTHDPELIAAYAAGDATGAALDQATDLVAACADCAALHRDLRSIASALPELPAPTRPRDFTLTPEQAASLRPSGWRGLVAAFASPRFRLAAPLGTGLAAAGLAGLLLASPGALTGGAAGPAAAEASGPAAAEQPVPGGPAAGGALAAPEVDPATAAASARAPVALAPVAATPQPDQADVTVTSPVVSDGRNIARASEAAPFTGTGEAVAGGLEADASTTGPATQALSVSADGALNADALDDSWWLPILAAVALVVGVALVALRLVARRLA